MFEEWWNFFLFSLSTQTHKHARTQTVTSFHSQNFFVLVSLKSSFCSPRSKQRKARTSFYSLYSRAQQSICAHTAPTTRREKILSFNKQQTTERCRFQTKLIDSKDFCVSFISFWKPCWRTCALILLKVIIFRSRRICNFLSQHKTLSPKKLIENINQDWLQQIRSRAI